jgi:hypothetical protein
VTHLGVFKRRCGLAAIGLALLQPACSASSQPLTLGALAGPGNVAALEAAVDCRLDDALRLAGLQGRAERPTYRLFSRFVQSAVYTELGEPARAAALIDEVTAGPHMNPDGATSRSGMQNSADAMLEAIRERRAEKTGNRLCSA